MDDHITQFDWCSRKLDTCFVTESDIDNSVIESIISNRFHEPPFVPSDPEEEEPRYKFNWDKIFTRKNENNVVRRFVPGLQPIPPYPKLSAIPGQQHFQCLKVISSDYPNVLETEVMSKPSKMDKRIYRDIQEVYAKEQQEFKEWAKQLWTTSHCRRALRPMPPIETVYQAEFKMRAHELKSFSKSYIMAAQIPLEAKNNICEMNCKKDLKSVNISDLPQVEYPTLSKERVTILKPCPSPQPCDKHPTRFVLPNESTPSVMPLDEINRELSQWALENGARFVANEHALKCLMELDHAWILPVSVCAAVTTDGNTNVIVLGSEFSVHKEPAPTRTYKAFKHLLENALIPLEQRAKAEEKQQNVIDLSRVSNPDPRERVLSTSDDEDNMVIDDNSDKIPVVIVISDEPEESQEKRELEKIILDQKKDSRQADLMDIDIYKCTCKDTIFAQPPPRSFRKWLIKNKTTGEDHSLIIHCSHKARGHTGEVILEPLPEYQLELGGSRPAPGTIAGLALRLALRKNAAVVNVRIDSTSGDIVTMDTLLQDEFTKLYGDHVAVAANRISTTLDQLQGLNTGNYILKHDPSHGTNAMLYAGSVGGDNLQFEGAQLAEPDEAGSVKTPPELVPVLLPFHKYRKILPLAFTPYEHQLAKEPQPSVSSKRQKTPPQALKAQQDDAATGRKWPKKRTKKRKR